MPINLTGRTPNFSISNPAGTPQPEETGNVILGPFVSEGPNEFRSEGDAGYRALVAAWNTVEDWWDLTFIEGTNEWQGSITNGAWEAGAAQNFVSIVGDGTFDAYIQLQAEVLPDLTPYAVGFYIMDISAEGPVPEGLEIGRTIFPQLEGNVETGNYYCEPLRGPVNQAQVYWDSDVSLWRVGAYAAGHSWISLQTFTFEELQTLQDVSLQMVEEGPDSVIIDVEFQLFVQESDIFTGFGLNVQFQNAPIPSEWDTVDLDGIIPAEGLVMNWPEYLYETGTCKHFIYQVGENAYVVWSEDLASSPPIIWNSPQATPVSQAAFDFPGQALTMTWNFEPAAGALVVFDKTLPVARVTVPYMLRKSAMPRDRVGLLNYARSLVNQGAAIESVTESFALALTAANTPSTRTPVTIQAAVTAEQQLRLAISQALNSVARADYERKSIVAAFDFPVPSIEGVTQRAGIVEFVFKGKPKGKNQKVFTVEMEHSALNANEWVKLSAVAVTKSPARLTLPPEVGGRKLRLRGRWTAKTSDRFVSGPWTAWTEFGVVSWVDA